MNDLRIVYITTDQLQPYPKNPRVHSESQVEMIARSITEFGFTNPILIDDKDMIIAGHGRVLAALKLGLQRVPCIRMDQLTDEQVKALVIADNKLAEASSWDQELLSSEIIDLENVEFDLSILGFSQSELSLLKNGWESDFAKLDGVEETNDVMMAKIKIKCRIDKKDEVLTSIKEALKEYEGVSVDG